MSRLWQKAGHERPGRAESSPRPLSTCVTSAEPARGLGARPHFPSWQWPRP